MKLNIGDSVRVKAGDAALDLTVTVEDASKGDIIQGKVEAIGDKAANDEAVFTYEVGKVYEFPRKDIQS